MIPKRHEEVFYEDVDNLEQAEATHEALVDTTNRLGMILDHDACWSVDTT